MIPESEKYNKVLNILRKSKPVLNSTEDIEREVLRRISKIHQSEFIISDVIDFLFGWIYIGWVRKTLVTASVVLVMVFVYQQGIILKQINYLSRQPIVIDGETTSTPAYEIDKMIMTYKLSGRRFPSRSITISDKQMKQLLESVNELQVKYNDLKNLIEDDPELKKLIEKKLIENSHTKINL
ncbi:MAG: hypothetical protein NTV31_03270 [Bacteroidia bacterium]|nr:hypothetical protein [Bacteroidia bacterium]